MMLHALSVHVVTNQSSLANHGVQRVNPPDFACLKQNGRWPQPTHRIPLPTAGFGKYVIQLLVKPKGRSKKNLVVFATLPGNDEPERSSWKPYSHDEMLNSIFQASGNDLSPEDSDMEFVESVIDSDTEDQNCLLHPKQGTFGDPVNHQGDLLDKLKALHLHVSAMEQWNASRLKICHKTYLASATNLIHYLALQCLDIHQLKEDLSSIGLLNLETINPHARASITAGIQMLESLTSNSVNAIEDTDRTATVKMDKQGLISTQGGLDCESKQEFTINTLRRMTSYHAESLFGPPLNGRSSHIMVTVGREAIHRETLISDLLKAGANVFRINCAHDGPSVWSEIIGHVKSSSQMLEKSCRILMDLAGPKLRTGILKAGPNVIKISPQEDSVGDVIFPAQVWLSYEGCNPPPHLSPDAILLLDDQWYLGQLEAGCVVRFSDVRGRKRALKISQKFQVFGGFGFMANCSRTAYVGLGTELYIKGKKRNISLGQVVSVPAVEQFIRLKVGDLLTISRDPCLSSNEVDNSAMGAPRITCSSGRLFDSVKPGEPIAFDDGRIWGVIQGVSLSEIIVSITRASPKGSKLGSEKSINIPRSEMQFEGLTSKDLMDLDFVAANADMVGISFIRDVRDVVIVQRELEKRNLRKLGIVLKIETQSGFEKLPLLLMQAMQLPNPLGVMIARGDLAVECGWDRLADMQEEILSICSAAHVPVIWATQVLESLVKSGLPTRAEITDVANGMRASCIMLNKGKHIVEAVSTLDSIAQSCSSRRKKMKPELKPLVPSSNLNP
ncbi:plastidial pyruvate kinase 4, chloroplastic [Magnolia sinica]|uniref:plastidial pyruvate kinase 4, chloroplastic n=1 Tax=Magnolia sinica TaxID=86752 RepID=UPI002658D7C0|nr:plastidial pyruvate kinase 4, chloroplastic [Magnolia sinica]XP_058100373.1 plastidial pyruvate kinase 4, chloroplastic [Magnolia sinica]